MNELLPCPFCGSNEIEIYNDNLLKNIFYKVECNNCESQTGWYSYKEIAIENWNQRA